MADNTGLRTTGIVTGLALLLLLLLQPYGGNYQPIVENTVEYDDSSSNNNNDSNSDTNLVVHSNEGSDGSNSNAELDENSSNTIQVEDGGGSAGNGGNGSGDDSSSIDTHAIYSGDAWLFIYPSNVSIVHLPIKCVALTTIDEVDYVECVLYRPDGNEHARVTINTGSSPSYTPLPSECNANCREFSAWFQYPNTPNTEGIWTVKAYFYSTNPGLITEREGNVKVYNAGGGSGSGDLPNGGFMVVPEYMLGTVLIAITSMAALAVYIFRVRMIK
ncbi:MAG: hypothetical protein QW560_02145 [Candidatus Nitrosocaldus sp.]